MLTELALRSAMRLAFSLGETHWRQADSDYTSDHRRADDTRRKFEALVEETVGLLVPSPPAVTSTPDDARIAILRDRFFDPAPGKRCIFDNEGGWPYQQVEAAKKLILGSEYVVTKVQVHSAHTRIWLAGQGEGLNDWFNSMMFRPGRLMESGHTDGAKP